MATNTQANLKSGEKRPNSLGELLLRFSEEKQAELPAKKAQIEVDMVESALRRTLLPALGGPTPIGERATPREIEAAERFLYLVPIEKLAEVEKIQEGYFETIEANGPFRRRHRCSLKKLLKFAGDKGWLLDPLLPARSRPPIAQEKPIPYYKHRLSDRTQPEAFTLGQVKQVEGGIKIILRNLKLKDVNNQPIATKGLLLSAFNPGLHQELNDLFRFACREKELRTITALNRLKEVCRLLGKLLSKDIPLSNLSLNQLVKPVKLQVPIPNFSKDRDVLYEMLFQKWTAEQEAKQEARKLRDLVQHNLESQGVKRKGFGGAKDPLHATSKVTCVATWILLAKFAFRDQTDITEYDDFGDIPAIRVLRRLQCQYEAEAKKAKRVFDRALKSITWNKFLNCVEQLRHQCKEEFNEKGEELSAEDKAVRLQKFLLLSFFALLPPLRQRTFRELQVGRTLVQGAMTESGFLPIHQMNNPEEARWFIALEPADYKTDKAYGSWHGEVPNFRYSDGSFFYQYLNNWLTHQRQLLNPSHYCVFSQENGKQYSASNLCKTLTRCLYNLSEVPVTPQILRSMFITYFKRLGASDAECNSFALAMQHSRLMQDGNYNDQLKSEKLAPAFAKMVEIASSCLRAS